MHKYMWNVLCHPELGPHWSPGCPRQEPCQATHLLQERTRASVMEYRPSSQALSRDMGLPPPSARPTAALHTHFEAQGTSVAEAVVLGCL